MFLSHFSPPPPPPLPNPSALFFLVALSLGAQGCRPSASVPSARAQVRPGLRTPEPPTPFCAAWAGLACSIAPL